MPNKFDQSVPEFFREGVFAVPEEVIGEPNILVIKNLDIHSLVLDEMPFELTETLLHDGCSESRHTLHSLIVWEDAVVLEITTESSRLQFMLTAEGESSNL
jgi:hypothetical protein